MISFRKLKNTDYNLLKAFAEKSFFESSFYCPASIIMWDGCLNSYGICEFDKGLLIVEEGDDYKDKKRLLMPVTERPLPPAQLKQILQDCGFRAFYYCPENYFNTDISAAEGLFNIYEQDGASDYIYRTPDLALLKGSGYSKKRNLISQFEKAYLENGLVETLILNKTNTADIMELSRKWRENNEEQELMDVMDCELKAIEKALSLWNELELFGISIYIDKKIAAFAIGSFLNPQTADLNFEKARKEIKGLYQFLDREFALSLPSHFKFINKEADMGRPGLAKAKHSYHPIKNPKSYILELK